MKKYFVPGLVTLLPLALTVMVVLFLFNLLTEPFVGIVKGILDHFDLLNTGFLFLSADESQLIVSKLLILVLLFFFTVFLGWLARWVFFHYMLRSWEWIVHRIPFVSNVYKTSQDVIKTLFTSDGHSFSQVVLAPFPSKATYCIGMLTKESLPAIPGTPIQNMAAVFIPSAPNPASGFVVLYKKEDLIHLDMKVEDAFKYVISCGVVQADIQISLPQEKHLA